MEDKIQEVLKKTKIHGKYENEDKKLKGIIWRGSTVDSKKGGERGEDISKI